MNNVKQKLHYWQRMASLTKKVAINKEFQMDMVVEVMDMVGRLTRWSKRWPSPSFFMLKLSDFY